MGNQDTSNIEHWTKYEDKLSKSLMQKNYEDQQVGYLRHTQTQLGLDVNLSPTYIHCHILTKHFPVLSSFISYHRVCNQNNTTGEISGAGAIFPSGAPDFTPGFQWGSCYSIFSFMCNVLQIVVCPFVLFLLAIVLSVLLRFTDSDYPFGIFKFSSLYPLQLLTDVSFN